MKNMIVAGVGGQGSILAAHILGAAAIASDIKNVRVGETYGAAMRGGSVVSHVRFGNVYGPLIYEDQAELIIAIEPLEGLRNILTYLAPGGTAIINDNPLIPVDVKLGYAQYPTLEQIKEVVSKLEGELYIVPASQIARDLGNIRTANVVMIGSAIATGLLPLAKKIVIKTIHSRVPPKTIEDNVKAFNQGYDFAQNNWEKALS
jgi:indolepyruvate ferredoxin oxidoreductase beta subunit